MKIRSITYFLNPGWPLDDEKLTLAENFIKQAKPAFEATGCEVQTARMATVPYPYLVRSHAIDVVKLALGLDAMAQTIGYDYISLGPALPADMAHYQVIPEVLKATERVFLTGVIADLNGTISLASVKASAEVIFRAATLSRDGFANLRFSALANVPPFAPFFPAAYHHFVDEGQKPAFALALETAGLVVEATDGSKSLKEVRERYKRSIEAFANDLTEVSQALEEATGTSFKGLDFTPAPFPQSELSFGTAIETLGISSIGLHGSLAGAAFFADTLDRADFLRAGFNGLFFPVLEDKILADRVSQGSLTVKDLLLYSTVCGAGLDTVPLPGDTSVEELYALLLDVAALSCRLRKPLTARLMPIPGKVAGDLTEFDFDYFTNSRVMSLQSHELNGLLRGNEVVNIARTISKT